MYEETGRKYRDEETWEQVRRAWEAGETGESCARRFDVGLDALWRRRAKGHWRRGRPADPAPEPVQGWDGHAEAQLEVFRTRLEEARRLAEALAAAMTGGPLDAVPLWHAGYVLGRRAELLGPEIAAQDKLWALERREWLAEFWDEDGRLKPVDSLDEVTLRANRAEWREDHGIPDGKAESWPAGY